MFALNRMREALRLIRINASAFLTFQLMIVITALGIDILRAMVFTILKGQLGVTALVQGNILQIFRHPMAAAVFVLLLLIELFVLLMGLIGNFRIYAASIRGERIGGRQLFRECIAYYLRLFTPSRILFLPLLVLTSLLSFVVVTTGTMESFRIPEFIIDWFFQKEILKYAYYVVRIGMTVVWGWMLFIMVGIFVEGKTFRDAIRDSRMALHGRKRKFVLFLILSMVVVSLLQSALYFAWMGLASFIQGSYARNIEMALRSTNQQAEIYLPMFGDILQIGLFVAAYCTLFGIPYAPRPKATAQKPWWKRALPILFIFFVLEVWYNDVPSYLFESEVRPEIIAHRAGGIFAPENSLEALEITKESQIASAVEIDVQMTKDGVLVLHHDDTLQRITGDPRPMAEMEWEELRHLPTRNTDGFMTAPPLPTLDAFMDHAGNMGLMIEIKEKGERAKEVLEKTIGMIHAKNLGKNSMIASMDRELLLRSKELDPQLTTVFITAVLIGEEFKDPSVDWFSIEASGLSIDLVMEAQEQGKKVVVWTINTLPGVKRALRARPHGIVTDNVYFADYSIDALEDKIWFQTEIMMHFVHKRQMPDQELTRE